MALARSASGPSGLSINTNSANNIFGSTTTPAPVGGMFGSTAASKPGGLFGSSTTGTTAPQTGGLFGSTTSQPPAGGLFGSTAATSAPTGGLFGTANATAQQLPTGGLFGQAATTTQPATGGLFGSAAPAQPATGGICGTTALASQPAQTGGLFGSATPATQPQAGGGLFGSSTAQPAQSGGLFGVLNNNQNKPASTMFGSGLGSQNQQQNQPQQSTMFSSLQQSTNQPQAQPSGLFAGSLGQNNAQNQQTAPGVRIDLSNLRGTTRFEDLHEDLQKEIMRMDDVIQSQIKLKSDCEAIMQSHDDQLAQVPNDVAFCNRKLVGVESAAVSDIKAISYVRDFIKTDLENAKLSFKAIDNLRLPPQYHNPTWANKSRSQGDGEDGAEDLVGLFSTTADELATTLTKYQNNITEIEQHLRGLEASSAQQINAFVAKRNGSSGVRDDPVAELAAALREFEFSILGVAGQVGTAREKVQTLQLGGFTESTNGKNLNGKRSGVY